MLKYRTTSTADLQRHVHHRLQPPSALQSHEGLCRCQRWRQLQSSVYVCQRHPQREVCLQILLVCSSWLYILFIQMVQNSTMLLRRRCQGIIRFKKKLLWDINIRWHLAKRVYYLSMEYNLGRSILNSLLCLGSESIADEALYDVSHVLLLFAMIQTILNFQKFRQNNINKY